MNYAGLLRSAFANHVVLFFDLAGVNVVDFLVGVILTYPFRRAVIRTGLLQTPTHLTNRQGGACLIDPDNSTFPARLLGGLRRSGSLMREHYRRQRKGKHQREQHTELLLHHLFLLVTGITGKM